MRFKLLKYCLFIFLSLVVGLWLSDHLFPLHLKRFHDHSTVITADQKPVHIFHSRDEKIRILTTLEDVDPRYIETLIKREDRYFKHHPGINPFAMVRAFYLYLRHGKIISGGSTITMQTARLLEPRPRTIKSKLIECFRALQLEWHYSKNEILSMYMTLAPFGGNIEGVNAASLTYFKKPPKSLDISEIALLVSLVQSPTRLLPHQHPEQALVARQRILDFMHNLGIITEQQAQTQHQAPLPTHKAKPPREIPHLAWRLKNQFPNQSKIAVTIDIPLQHQVEHVLKHYQRSLPKNANAAILIVDHEQNKPIAYLGSRDFYQQAQNGFVDYIQAIRSPGSTLKPFIYGLGFELGSIKPNSLIMDQRRRFGAYSPHNFDKDIHGVVRIQDALRLSLNIPAVDVLNQIGVIRFMGLLKEANIEPKFPSVLEGPSLAVSLGGLGMTLEQLVTLYSGLARNGLVAPISYVGETQTPSYTRILSTRTSQLLTQILAYELNQEGDLISFKTGTSYGHRDLLVVGYNQRYVVGIWIGLPSGAPMGPISSRELTVPLLEKIFYVLPKADIARNSEITQPKIALKDLANTQFHETLSQQGPQLMFPVNESVLDLENYQQQLTSIPLTVNGGQRPYTWLVDGKIITQQCWQQKYFWRPANNGFYTITVLDANGKADRVRIEVQGEVIKTSNGSSPSQSANTTPT